MSAPATTHDQTEQRRQQALAAAEACIAMLTARFGAKRVVLFGSLAGQGPWHSRSDIDLAVEGLSSSDFFPAYSACFDLVPPEIDFDLVEIETISPEMRARVLGEQPMSNNPMENLRSLIEDELTTIQRIEEEIKRVRLRISDEDPDQDFLHALGSHLQRFYTAVETIFERITIWTGGTMPAGSSWHKDLLHQMAENRPGIRPAIIDTTLRDVLVEYLKFRHFFRHAYSLDLEWENNMLPLAEGMPRAAHALQLQVRAFLDRIADERTSNNP